MHLSHVDPPTTGLQLSGMSPASAAGTLPSPAKRLLFDEECEGLLSSDDESTGPETPAHRSSELDTAKVHKDDDDDDDDHWGEEADDAEQWGEFAQAIQAKAKLNAATYARGPDADFVTERTRLSADHNGSNRHWAEKAGYQKAPMMMEVRQPSQVDVELLQAKALAPKPNRTSGIRGPVWVIVPLWISLSVGLILSNKYLYTELGFPFPISLTAYHMLCATVATNLMRLLYKIIGIEFQVISVQQFMRTMLPLSILFAASLVLCNLAYVHLSISFVQMVKAAIPVTVLILEIFAGFRRLWIIAIVSAGCFMAASGEAKLSLIGFVWQLAATFIEAVRLVGCHRLLHNYAMDPLVVLYYNSPVCFLLIACCLPFTEGLGAFRQLSHIGLPTLILNGLVAFGLKFSSIILLKAADSMVLMLSGVIKDILLVSLSVVLMGSHVSMEQVMGYTIALGGLIAYKLNGTSGGPMRRFLMQRVVRPLLAPIADRMNQIVGDVKRKPS